MMSWSLLPEPVLLSILSYCHYYEIIQIGYTCKRWNIVSNDNLLWKTVLCRDFQMSKKTKIHPSGSFWKEEYKRLIDETPNVMSEELCQDDEVLHVAFSNSGNSFVTCCKDATFTVLNMNNDGTTSLRYRGNMTNCGWQYTSSAQFNSSDSLLLVTGEYEVAVFECPDVGDYVLLHKIRNNHIFVPGTWWDENTWISGQVRHDPLNPTLIDTIVDMRRAYPGHEHHLQSEVTLNNIAFKTSKYLCQFILMNRNVGSIKENKICLAFRCGEPTIGPHQIGFLELHPKVPGSDDFISAPDKLIEMHGQTVAMTQDREGRFLYVNLRLWPEAAVPSEDDPPPIADDIVTKVIDLQDLSLRSQVYGSPKGYSVATTTFVIYPAEEGTFVGSGSEDGSAYIWDTHYGCQLAANKHDDVVSCVAFSPKDSSLMVSVSDDHKAKIWISRRRARSLRTEPHSGTITE